MWPRKNKSSQGAFAGKPSAAADKPSAAADKPSAAAGKPSAADFSAEMYRAFNNDLRHLSDAELFAHFSNCQREPRIFGPTRTTAEFLSMRWLRGCGLEVGAGGNPIKLFGEAQALHADVDTGLAVRGEKLDAVGAVDDPQFASKFRQAFDFAMASHVLEHCDGFIRAIENLLALVRPGGIIYIILPDSESLTDKDWLPYFDFAHHADDYENPAANCDRHDKIYIEARRSGIASTDRLEDLPAQYRDMIQAGTIAPKFRFLHHKHDYNFGDWLEIIVETRRYLNFAFELLETRYGHERKDCHFILRRPVA